MDISDDGRKRARARAHERTRDLLPDEEQRAAAITAGELVAMACKRSPYGGTIAAVRQLARDGVIAIEVEGRAAALGSRIAQAFATIAADEAQRAGRTAVLP